MVKVFKTSNRMLIFWGDKMIMDLLNMNNNLEETFRITHLTHVSRSTSLRMMVVMERYQISIEISYRRILSRPSHFSLYITRCFVQESWGSLFRIRSRVNIVRRGEQRIRRVSKSKTYQCRRNKCGHPKKATKEQNSNGHRLLERNWQIIINLSWVNWKIYRKKKG